MVERTKSNHMATPTEIELQSGYYFDLTKPHTTPVDIHDVAWGLAHVNRYTGQASRPFSVAEHSVLVSRRIKQTGGSCAEVLAGLYHDAAEAFVGDVSRSLKALLPDYRWIERRVQNAVMKHLGLDALPKCAEDPRIKDADTWALSAEAYYLMPSRGDGWFCQGIFDPDSEAQDDLARSVIMRLDHKNDSYGLFLREDVNVRYLFSSGAFYAI